MPELISREDAKQQGLKFYFAGKPCIRQHLSERYTSNNYCLACCKAKDKQHITNRSIKRRNKRVEESEGYAKLFPDKQILSLKEARNLGLTRYFTGKPCKRGHVADRYVQINGSTCTICSVQHTSKWNKSNPEKIKDTATKGRTKRLKTLKIWRAKNRKKLNKRANDRYYQDLENSRKRARVWAREHPEVGAHHTNLRRARKLNATPKWVDLQEIKEIYLARPKGYHVDHIIPLQGINEFGEHVVCGLHVPYNLQYLTAEQNMRKRNFFS